MIAGTPRIDDYAWFAVIVRADYPSSTTTMDNNNQYISFFSLSYGLLSHSYQECTSYCAPHQEISLANYSMDGEWHRIRVSVKNDLMTTYVDDVLRLNSRDSRLVKGRPGFSFSCCTGLTYYFDNILVVSLD